MFVFMENWKYLNKKAVELHSLETSYSLKSLNLLPLLLFEFQAFGGSKDQITSLSLPNVQWREYKWLFSFSCLFTGTCFAKSICQKYTVANYRMKFNFQTSPLWRSTALYIIEHFTVGTYFSSPLDSHTSCNFSFRLLFILMGGLILALRWALGQPVDLETIKWKVACGHFQWWFVQCSHSRIYPLEAVALKRNQVS